jgi:hypothetical protein
MKLGMAIAANIPMMATTIMISTNVKPALPVGLVVFILCCHLFQSRREQHNKLIYMMTLYGSLIACCNRNLSTF